MNRFLAATTLLAASLGVFADEGRVEISSSSLPMVITNSGAYILTENLSGDGFNDAITVSASHVNIDLNGFEMVGANPSGDGIQINAVSGVTIKNGVLRNWAGHGINGALGTACVYQDLSLSANGQSGLKAGTASRIHDITSYSNGEHGIDADKACLIRNCTVTANGTDSIGSGIVVNENCTVLECNATANATYEIQATTANRIERNLCDCNGSGTLAQDSGIYIAGNYNLVEKNHISGCNKGIDIPSTPARNNNIVVGNTAAGNTANFSFTGDNMIGQEVVDVNSTNNLNTANALMNLSK